MEQKLDADSVTLEEEKRKERLIAHKYARISAFLSQVSLLFEGHEENKALFRHGNVVCYPYASYRYDAKERKTGGRAKAVENS